MRGIFINQDENSYVTYSVEGEESDEVEFIKIFIEEPEEWMDVPSGTIVEFAINIYDLFERETTLAYVKNIIE